MFIFSYSYVSPKFIKSQTLIHLTLVQPKSDLESSLSSLTNFLKFISGSISTDTSVDLGNFPSWRFFVFHDFHERRDMFAIVLQRIFR